MQLFSSSLQTTPKVIDPQLPVEEKYIRKWQDMAAAAGEWSMLARKSSPTELRCPPQVPGSTQTIN